MSATDLPWLLPPLAGVVLGWRLRPSVVPLLLGFVLLIASLVMFGYSMDNYSNGDCEPDAPCPTGEQVIRVALPVAFLLGAPLVLMGFGRIVWEYVAGLWTWRRRRA